MGVRETVNLPSYLSSSELKITKLEHCTKQKLTTGLKIYARSM